MNILLMVCILIIGIIALYISNKYLEKYGLFTIFITSNIVSFIQTFKFIPISNFIVNANIIPYTTLYTSIFLLLEKNKKEELKKHINMTLILNLFIGIILYLTSLHTQSINDTIGINMTNVFINNYRILIAFPLSIFLSEKLLLFIYDKIKKLYDNLFISMVTTYLAIGLIESIIYILISYYNLATIQTLIKILLSSYMMRLIITVIYSIVLNFTNRKVVKK